MRVSHGQGLSLVQAQARQLGFRIRVEVGLLVPRVRMANPKAPLARVKPHLGAQAVEPSQVRLLQHFARPIGAKRGSMGLTWWQPPCGVRVVISANTKNPAVANQRAYFVGLIVVLD